VFLSIRNVVGEGGIGSSSSSLSLPDASPSDALGARGSALGAIIMPIYAQFGPDTGVLMKKGKGLDKKPL